MAPRILRLSLVLSMFCQLTCMIVDKLYTEMNKKFHQVLLYTGLGRLSTILANAYQLMVIPGTYQPLVMTEITADLYNLFIVTYTVHRPSGKPSVQEVDMSTYQR